MMFNELKLNIMKKSTHILSWCFLFLGTCGSINAQTTKEEYQRKHQDYLSDRNTRLVKIGQLDDSIRELKGSPEAILRLEKSIDSLRNVKRDLEEQKAGLLGSNAASVAKNTDMGEYNLFIEECICRFANGRLALQYDEENVNKAIRYMDSVKDEALLTRFKDVPSLLRRYSKDYNEFMAVIKEAQKDIDRTDPLSDDSYRKKYIGRLKNLSYYKDYYITSENKWKGWRIYYLSDEIGKAMNLLERHDLNSDSPYMVDFNYLLLEQ